MREREGKGERGEGGLEFLRSRSSCQIVCNISTPPVSHKQPDRLPVYMLPTNLHTHTHTHTADT